MGIISFQLKFLICEAGCVIVIDDVTADKKQQGDFWNVYS